MSRNKIILFISAFIWACMLLGAKVFEKLWAAPDLIDVFKQLGLVAIFALMALGIALFLVRVLKVKINPR